jgi:hypothetical protein
MIQPDKNDMGKFTRAHEFWENASAYAAQSAPYGVERMQELDQMADEIAQGMQMMPPEIQQKIHKKLKAKLIDPVEGDTAQEFDSAWHTLQVVSKQLHTDLMPKMSSMAGLAGPMGAPNPVMDQGMMDMAQEEMPTGPHMMPDGTMMGAY